MRQDGSYVRIHYVRYADDFIIGVEGSFEQAQEVLRKVSAFIESTLELKLNPAKTGITNYSKKPIPFLGYTLAAPHLMGTKKPIELLKNRSRIITRRKKVRVRIHMDY